jgi:hypothetical protein
VAITPSAPAPMRASTIQPILLAMVIDPSPFRQA